MAPRGGTRAYLDAAVMQVGAHGFGKVLLTRCLALHVVVVWSGGIEECDGSKEPKG